LDEVITGTDHRCLWIDIHYKTAFGHDGTPNIIKSAARKLNTQNPNIRDNFNTIRKKYTRLSGINHRIIALENSIIGEMSPAQIQENEAIDTLRTIHVKSAEKRCRKLRNGNVPYSTTLQNARNKIEAWSLLHKFKKVLKVSSRKLSRCLKKADVTISAKKENILAIQDELKAATIEYYKLKKKSTQLRESHLESLASALAANGNTKKESILKQLRLRESQRSTARKLKYLRGQLSKRSTTMVSITLPDGSNADITDKKEMEKTIIAANKKKFQQSFGTPFYKYPYNTLFGYQGVTKSSQKVLDGTFIPPADASNHMKDFLYHAAMPTAIKQNPTQMELTVESFISYWKKAREHTACYPSELFCHFESF
jgi:hypothetical protein